MVPIEPFVDTNLNEWVSISLLTSHFYIILPPHSQVILHAGLARSCRIHISKSKGKPSPLGRRSPAGQMSGDWLELALAHRLQRSLLSWRVWVFHVCGFCDFAFGFAQNDRGLGAYCEDGRFRIRGTNQKGVWGYGYRFFIDPRYIVFYGFICWGLICKSTICSNLSGSYRAFCRYKLEWMGLFFDSAFSLIDHSATSLTGHSARRACPELQNPNFKKSIENPLLWEEEARQGGDEGLC